MATYLSDSINDRAYVSTGHEQGEAIRSISSTITIPAGKALAAADILKFVRLEAGHAILRANAIVSSSLGASSDIDLGTYQVLKDAVAVRSSPANATAAIQDGNTTLHAAGLKAFTIAADAVPYAGPVDVALTVVAVGTAVDNTERSITLILEVVRAGRVQSNARLDRGGF